MKEILFKNYINAEKGKDFLIIGAGYSIIEYKNSINSFIEEKSPVLIGINNMNHVFIPDYHLWTNNQRFKDLGNNINKSSMLMLGCGIKKELIKGRWNNDYILVNYVDKKGVSIGYEHNIVKGYFRTAGCLSIFLSYLMGAKNIYIVGMDGYTLHSKRDLEKDRASHHCYGRGYTDDASWERCNKKDKIVYRCLENINRYGVNFSILTPTVFTSFFNNSIMGISDGKSQ